MFSVILRTKKFRFELMSTKLQITKEQRIQKKPKNLSTIYEEKCAIKNIIADCHVLIRI